MMTQRGARLVVSNNYKYISPHWQLWKWEGAFVSELQYLGVDTFKEFYKKTPKIYVT